MGDNQRTMLQSCGIIPYRYNASGEIEFFVGHPGHHSWIGKNYWLYIKGHREDGEECLTTAKREFKEETGISLDDPELDNQFIYLGEIQQSMLKKCVAYGLHYPNIDPNKCHSDVDENGEFEIDQYKWETFDTLMRCTHPSHYIFYRQLRDMALAYDGNYTNVCPDSNGEEEILDDSGY